MRTSLLLLALLALFSVVPLIVWWCSGDWRAALQAARGYAMALGVPLAIGLLLALGAMLGSFLAG